MVNRGAVKSDFYSITMRIYFVIVGHFCKNSQVLAKFTLFRFAEKIIFTVYAHASSCSQIVDLFTP